MTAGHVIDRGDDIHGNYVAGEHGVDGAGDNTACLAAGSGATGNGGGDKGDVVGQIVGDDDRRGVGAAVGGDQRVGQLFADDRRFR